ncbi:MAG: zinc metallopeptidase [Chitinophagales bacterium]
MYVPYMIVSLALLAISYYLQYRLKSVFQRYAQFPTVGNLSGAEVAARMLRDNGINDVKIQSVDGALTDHYNPTDKTVNLSADVFNGRSVTAAAIAAHECGHAVQHATAYSMLKLRSGIVPAVQVASRWNQWIILGGLGLSLFAGSVGFIVLAIGVGLFAFTTFFSLVTLPVEFDASARALAWLKTNNVTGLDHDKSKELLTWAAMTYVVAAAASIVNLWYYISLLMGRRRD